MGRIQERIRQNVMRRRRGECWYKAGKRYCLVHSVRDGAKVKSNAWKEKRKDGSCGQEEEAGNGEKEKGAKYEILQMDRK